MNRFLFLIFFLISVCAWSNAENVPGAVFDLKNHDFSKKQILALDMQWELYGNSLLFPSDFNQGRHTTRFDTLTRPLDWKNTKFHGKNLGNTGYATYRLTLLNVPDMDMMLEIYSVQTSSRIFINDSLMAEVGHPGTDKESTVPMNRDVEIHLPKGLKQAQIIVQIANFHHRKGGFVHPFEIGTAEAISKQRLVYYILGFSETSALLIIGLFLFALYIFRRKDASILYFSLFCISLSFRPITSVNYLIASVFTDINWSFLVRLDYLSMLFPCFFMVLFIKKLFPDQLSHLIVKILLVIISFNILVTIFFPPSVFSWLIPVLLFVISAGVVIFAITIFKAIAARVEGAVFAGAGLVVLLVSLLLKVLVYSGFIAPVHVLITILDIGFIFMMSLILGTRFSLQFSRVERLKKQTELQHSEILKQKKEVERQKGILEEKNNSIIDSINYAKRIQTSLLTPESYIERKLRELTKGKS